MRKFDKVILTAFIVIAAVFSIAASVGIGRETAWSQSLKLAASAAAGRTVIGLDNASTPLFAGLIVTNASANNNPMVRFKSDAGLPQMVFEDLDANDAQEPFVYLQSANNGAQGRFYIGFADRSGTNLTGNTDIALFSPTLGLQIQGATPILNTVRQLGVDRGSATTSNDGKITNSFNITFASAPIVVTTPSDSAAVVLTNTVYSITTTNCVINLGAHAKVVNWIAVGVP